MHESTSSGDVPTITATVRFPRRRGSQGGPRIVPRRHDRRDRERRIAILEARWSESFVPMTRGEVFKWAVPFLWRAISRMLSLFVGTMVLRALVHDAAAPQGRPQDSSCSPGRVNFVVDGCGIIVGTGFFVVVWLFVVLARRGAQR